MVRYQRLKSIDGSGTIMRYYELADGEKAYTNAFYAVKNGKATKIEGTVSEAGLIGFSHGGNALAKGLIFLDVNPSVAYLCALEDGDKKPAIGDVVNGYLKVIDTHYDNDEASGKGTNPEEWGIERMDNPYFIAVINQPNNGAEVGIDDSGCGELTPYQKSGEESGDDSEYTVTIKNIDPTSDCNVMIYPIGGEPNNEPLEAGKSFNLGKVKAGKTLGSVYMYVHVVFGENKNIVIPVDVAINKNTTYEVKTPVTCTIGIENQDQEYGCTITAVTRRGETETYENIGVGHAPVQLAQKVEKGTKLNTVYDEIYAEFGVEEETVTAYVDLNVVVENDVTYGVAVPHPQIGAQVRLNNVGGDAITYTAVQNTEEEETETGTIDMGESATLELTVSAGEAISTRYKSITCKLGSTTKTVDLSTVAPGNKAYIDVSIDFDGE